MFRFLINLALLVLPIAVTLGVLFGLQAHRDATGQEPLFGGPDDNGKGSNGKPKKGDNGVETDTYCQKAFGIHPYTKGQEYTLNPNQWGWTEGSDGALCLNVTTFNNQTYSSKTTAPEWSVTWQYPVGVATAPVHAYPNIMLDGDVLPVQMSTLNHIEIDFEWTMGIGDKPVKKTKESDLLAENVNTNVAIDMFIDEDKKKAADNEKAKYEVMVWFAQIGSSSHTIGQDDGAVLTKTVDGTTFELFVGENEKDQTVMTWLAKNITETFNGDLTPLLDELFDAKNSKYPSRTDYIGYFSLGTEAYSSDKNVTFHVPKLSIDLQTK